MLENEDHSVNVHHRSPCSRRYGWTLRETAVCLFVLILVIALMVPSIQRGVRLSRRSVCAANLRSIGTGMTIYAGGVMNIEGDLWPIADHAPAIDDEKGQVQYAPGKIGWNRGGPGSKSTGVTTVNDIHMSTTRTLYALHFNGFGPKSFICPAASDRGEPGNPRMFSDFKSYNNISYGIQVPYGKFGKPGLNSDRRVPLIADKGPYGAALEAGQPHPGRPTADCNSPPDTWQPWNSPNHDGQGQHVLYSDGYVTWCRTPIVGMYQDNIYTRWLQADGGLDDNVGPRVHGTPPTCNETPWSNTDSLIYP